MAESSVREVIYRIKVEPDPKGAAETKRFADDLRTKFTQMNKERSEEAKKAALFEREAIKGIGRAFSDTYKGVRKEIRDTMADAEKARREMISGNQQVAHSFETVTSGAMKVSRAVVLFGNSSKELRPLIDSLVKFQVVADGITGTLQVVRGLEQAWHGVKMATMAATAAQAAHNALTAQQAASGLGFGEQVAAGAAGDLAARGVAKGVKGGVREFAGEAVGSAAGVLGLGAAAKYGGAIKNFGLNLLRNPSWMMKAARIATIPTGFYLGGRSIYESLTGPSWTTSTPGSQNESIGRFYANSAESLGLIDRGTRRSARMESDVQNRIIGRYEHDTALSRELAAQNEERNMRIGQRIDVFRSRGDIGGALGISRMEVGAARGALDKFPIGGPEQDAARERLTQALERQKDLLTEQKKIVEDKARVAVGTAEKELDLLRQQREQRLGTLRELKQETASAQERFAMLDPVQQGRMVDLAKKAKGGAQLSREESQQLSGFRELGGVEGQLQKSFEALAGSAFKEFLQITGQAEAQRKAEFQVAAVNATLELKSNVRVALENNSRGEAKAIAEQLLPIIAQITQERVAALERELDRQSQQVQAQNAQRARIGSG